MSSKRLCPFSGSYLKMNRTQLELCALSHSSLWQDTSAKRRIKSTRLELYLQLVRTNHGRYGCALPRDLLNLPRHLAKKSLITTWFKLLLNSYQITNKRSKMQPSPVSPSVSRILPLKRSAILFFPHSPKHMLTQQHFSKLAWPSLFARWLPSLEKITPSKE